MHNNVWPACVSCVEFSHEINSLIVYFTMTMMMTVSASTSALGAPVMVPMMASLSSLLALTSTANFMCSFKLLWRVGTVPVRGRTG